MKKLLLTSFLLFILCSCNEKKYQLKGFAFYDNPPQAYLFKAISPEGVVVQGKEINNKPEKTSEDFWAKAINNYLPKKGYRLIKKDMKAKTGKHFVFLVPGVKYDYFYLVSFYVQKDKIKLLEAGGRYAYLKNYQEKILKFAKSVWTNK